MIANIVDEPLEKIGRALGTIKIATSIGNEARVDIRCGSAEASGVCDKAINYRNTLDYRCEVRNI